MKKTLLLFAALYFSLSFGEGWGEVAFAQTNLVPNPSFEDTINCPQMIGDFKAANWYVVEQTPDYFNSCCTTPNQCSVPSNAIGYRNAPTGNAYCGLFNYNWTFYREKIGVKLIDTLKIGKKYNLSFKVSSVCKRGNMFSNATTNKVGFLFSTVKYDLSHLSPTNNFSNFKADSLIKDTIGWELISGSFTADSAYSYLNIGNFFDDSHTDTMTYWHTPGTYVLRAYALIDDIYVGYDSTQDHIGINDVTEKDISVYPNPSDTKFTINFNGYYFQSISIVDLLGRQIYFDYKLTTTKKEIDVSQFPTGSYIIQFNASQTKFNKKINIIHN